MTNDIRAAAWAFTFAAIAGPAWAGGQQIAAEVGGDGRSVVVRTYRCGTPSTFSVSGTAEGLVGGERRTLPLRLERAGEGVFEVARQWPQDGVWVLSFTVAGQRPISTLVELAPGPDLRITAQQSTYEKPTARHIEDVLRASR